MPALLGQVKVLSASSVKAASGNSGVVQLPGVSSALFLLNVTASSGPTTLDVYLQTSPDLGVTYYDFGHFTQVGAVATSIQALQWSRECSDGTQGTSVIVTGDAALAAAKVICGPIVDSWFRAKWVVAGTSYTFALTAILDRET